MYQESIRWSVLNADGESVFIGLGNSMRLHDTKKAIDRIVKNGIFR